MTPETISKLEQVFAIGGTDKEACSYADISHQTLYKYQEEHPEFTERKEMLKEKPFIKARQTIVKALEDPKDAQWFMERKRKDEFANRHELTGEGGKDLIPENTPEAIAKAKAFDEWYKNRPAQS